jgi:hypothetical protein
MNIGWNIETGISVASLVIAAIILVFIIKINWQKYGLLYLLSAGTGVALCYIFIGLNLYTFPYRLFPSLSRAPLTLVLGIFPLLVLLGVRYSPKPWLWKIPFYWVMVHSGMFVEAWAEQNTQIIKYNPPWDTWDSYTWWWIFLLVFEWVGGLMISPEWRKPMDQEFLRYGKLGWFILHFILISTIFLAGVYTKTMLS